MKTNLEIPSYRERIPNRANTLRYAHEFLKSDDPPEIETLHHIISRNCRKGVRPYKNINPVAKLYSKPNLNRIKEANEAGFSDRYLDQFQDQLENIASQRFFNNSRQCFLSHKKLTKYDQHNKS
jgi:hypothetical protein